MNALKKNTRKQRNLDQKAKRAQSRQAMMALLGKTVIETKHPVLGENGLPVEGEFTTTLDFPPFIKTAADGSLLPMGRAGHQNPPHLVFVGAKSHPHHGAQSKLRPGNAFRTDLSTGNKLSLHEEATCENASRSLMVEIDKILNPPEAEDGATKIPVIPENLADTAAQL